MIAYSRQQRARESLDQCMKRLSQMSTYAKQEEQMKPQNNVKNERVNDEKYKA
jgi:hypothetical protein